MADDYSIHLRMTLTELIQLYSDLILDNLKIIVEKLPIRGKEGG